METEALAAQGRLKMEKDTNGNKNGISYKAIKANSTLNKFIKKEEVEDEDDQ